jgi:hypothetical protein
MPKLGQKHGVSEVDIWRCRVETCLDPELFSGRNLGFKLLSRDNFHGTAPQQIKL